MRIEGNGGIRPAAEIAEAATASPAAAAHHKSQGSVSVSARAKAMHDLAAQVDQAPEARADRVAELKQKISTGQHQVDLDKLAQVLDKIL